MYQIDLSKQLTIQYTSLSISVLAPVAYPEVMFGAWFNKFSWRQRTERTGIWRR